MFCTGKEQLTCNSEKMGCEGCYFNNDKNKDEIKVGEYVRVKGGYIGKVERIVYDELLKKNYYACGDNEIMASGFKEDIVKHSSNIIDLIECGDYVNGKEISNVDKIDNANILEWEDGIYSTKIPNDKFIKSIVTKEQFSSVEYRLEE